MQVFSLIFMMAYCVIIKKNGDFKSLILTWRLPIDQVYYLTWKVFMFRGCDQDTLFSTTNRVIVFGFVIIEIGLTICSYYFSDCFKNITTDYRKPSDRHDEHCYIQHLYLYVLLTSTKFYIYFTYLYLSCKRGSSGIKDDADEK